MLNCGYNLYFTTQVILNIGWTVKTLTNEIYKRNLNPQISKTFFTAVTRFIVLSFTKHVSIWVKVIQWHQILKLYQINWSRGLISPERRQQSANSQTGLELTAVTLGRSPGFQTMRALLLLSVFLFAQNNLLCVCQATANTVKQEKLPHSGFLLRL